MSSEQVAATAETEGPSAGEASGRRRTLRNLGIVVVAVIALDILALLFVPPFPRGGQPGEACAFPVCFINGTLEFPPPHVVLDLDPANPMPEGQAVVTFHPSITSTIVTMWIIMAILLVLAFVATRGMRLVPRSLQNLCEFAYESLENFGIGLGGNEAKPYIPLFASFFVLILFCNWSGLIPPIGKIEELRAPTSRPQHHDRARPGRVRLLRVPGLPAPRCRRLPEQVLPVLRVPQGDRRRDHRPVRRPHRAHARVRQAGHAVDAALRQHLRRRGRARRRSARCSWSSCRSPCTVSRSSSTSSRR